MGCSGFKGLILASVTLEILKCGMSWFQKLVSKLCNLLNQQSPKFLNAVTS